MTVTDSPRAHHPLSFLDLDGVAGASMGDKAAAALVLLKSLGQDLAASDAYEKFARYTPDTARADWNSSLASDSGQPQESARLVEPDNYWDSLPEINHVAEALQTALAGAQTLLSGHTQRATASSADQQDLLGVPEGARGYRDGRKYFTESVGIGTREAKQRQQRSEFISGGPPPISGGPEIPPEFPAATKAFSIGSISTEHLDRLIRLVNDVKKYARNTHAPPGLIDQLLDEVVPLLVERAEELSVNEFNTLCKEWLPKICHHIDQDGPAPEEVTDPQRGREDFWVRPREDGGLDFGGTVYGLSAELLSTIDHAANNYAALKNNATNEAQAQTPRNPLIKAIMANFPELKPHDVISVDENGTEQVYAEHDLLDRRSRNQRTLNALFAVLIAGLGAGRQKNALPSTRGQDTKMIVTMDYETFSHQLSRRFQLDEDLRRSTLRDWLVDDPTTRGHRFRSEGQYSATIHPSRLRAMACHAGIIPQLMDGDHEVLDMGRQRRDFSAAQHRCLVARDRGCATPGCTMPPAWCHVHHITEWEHGGETDIDNAVLLCSAHHTDVHTGKWSIVRVDREGVWFSPAPWLNPDPTPRRNVRAHS